MTKAGVHRGVSSRSRRRMLVVGIEDMKERTTNLLSSQMESDRAVQSFVCFSDVESKSGMHAIML